MQVAEVLAEALGRAAEGWEMNVFLLLCCLNPVDDVARDRVDVIEINHFYDEQGRLVFDQTIFYDWSPDHSRYMVRAWRLVKNPS